MRNAAAPDIVPVRRYAVLLQADSLAHERQVPDRPAQLIVNRLRESARGGRLAMHDVGMLRRLVEAAQPVDQAGLIAWADRRPRMDRGPDRNRLAEDMHQAAPVDQPAAQCPRRLEARDEDAAFAARRFSRRCT